MRERVANINLKICSSVTWKAFCIFGENDIELLQIPVSDFSDTDGIIRIELEDLESLKASFRIRARVMLSTNDQIS